MASLSAPEVHIPLKTWEKLQAYVQGCDTEITGFFDVDYDPVEHAFVLGEVYLVEQTAGGADVEMDEEAIADFTYQMISKGQEQLPRGWWHSHVKMAVFFSGTDDKTINTDFSNDTFTLSIVLNKHKETKASVVIWQEIPYNIFEAPLRIDDLKVVVQGNELSIPAAIKKEIAKKVKTRVPAPYTPPTYDNGRWYKQNDHKGKRKVVFEKINGKTPNSLPKSRVEALGRISDLNLTRKYFRELTAFGYESTTGEVWIDVWGCISVEDYVHLKGKDDTDKSQMIGGIDRTDQLPFLDDENRCLSCGYHRDYHKHDYCGQELYPSDISDLNGHPYSVTGRSIHGQKQNTYADDIDYPIPDGKDPLDDDDF